MKFIKAHVFDIALFLLWIAFGVLQWYMNMAEFTSEQMEHGQSFEMSEFLPFFWGRFAENHSSEMFQLFLAARFGYLAGKKAIQGWGSKFPEGDQSLQLDRIERKVYKG